MKHLINTYEIESKEGGKVAFDAPMWEDTSHNGELDISFHMQIPQFEMDSDEVYIIFEAVADAVIETDELYSTNGEYFASDSTEKSKIGQKIVYKLPLGE